MNLGMRPRVQPPLTYKGFRILRTHGWVYGVPPFLVPELRSTDLLQRGELFSHPAILKAPTLEELLACVDGYDPRTQRPQVVGSFQEYDVVSHRGSLYGVPQLAGEVDLDLSEERQRAGVIIGGTRRELEENIRGRRASTGVEFGGWLPVYRSWGNCGQHPQFTHTAEPPPGYHFTRSAPPYLGWEPAESRGLFARAWKKMGKIGGVLAQATRPLVAFFRPDRRITIGARIRVLGAVVRLFFRLLWHGGKPLEVLQFLQTRHLQSQLLLSSANRGLVFLTSMPFTYGQNPWIIEIEDPTTLFYPFLHNGHTDGADIRRFPYYPIVRSMLESEQCKAILTHMKSTAQMVPTLFDSDIIRKKVMYAPLGVKLPARWQRHEEAGPDEPIHLLFINSWCQVAHNFYLRGGLDILEAFDILRVRYPQLRLTMRTELPALNDHYRRIIERGWVRVINRFLPAEQMAELHASSHIFLLPAARVHIVSLLHAMAHGLAVVTSDGWGIDEYIEHERNGLIVKGRYGKASWADMEAGLLRENYDMMITPHADVVEGLVIAISRLVEDRLLRAHLGRAARSDVETKYSMEQWNRALKRAFDRARGISSQTPGEDPVLEALVDGARLSEPRPSKEPDRSTGLVHQA
jgi:glycosyltransferase involved in cell wall biosynthesis